MASGERAADARLLMSEGWLDERELREEADRRRRAALQLLARAVLQAWQKRRLAALRARLSERTGRPLGLNDVAGLLGWEQTRVYEAARDFSDLGRGSAKSRMWPRLRSLDELLALELLEIELTGSAGESPAALGAFVSALSERFTRAGTKDQLRRIENVLAEARATEQELVAVSAWLCGRRKDAAVRDLSSTRIEALLPAVLPQIQAAAIDELEQAQRASRRRTRNR